MNALTPISAATPLSRAMSAFAEARRFPLRVRCLGEIDYAQDDPADGVFPVPRTLDLALSASLSEAIARIKRSVLQDIVAPGGECCFRFIPRLFFVVDDEQCLVIAGEPSHGSIKWCAPVASDGEARLVVHTASKLRGEASREAGSNNHENARILRFRASVLEGRLVHSNWRQRASTALLQAA